MPHAFIPTEQEQQIESLRGDTPFETWVALAIQEKVWGSRFAISGVPGRIDLQQPGEPPEDLWVAMVQFEGGAEMFLLWRYSMASGVALAPVFVTEWEHAAEWAQIFGAELNFMEGPAIVWRHFQGGEFVEYLRAPAVEEPDGETT